MMDIEKIRSLAKTHSQAEIAEVLGCSTSLVGWYIRKHGIEYKHKGRWHKLKKSMPKGLSSYQDEIILGSMLGDGHIDQRGRFKIEQSVGFQEYVDELHACLRPFSGALRTQRARKPDTQGRIADEYWGGQYLYKRRFSTYKHEVFQNLRHVWYPSGKKIVPVDIKLTPTVMLHWLCQDGSNTEGMFRIHTNGFTETEVLFLIDRLKIDLNLESHILFHQDWPIIVIGSRDNASNLKLVKMMQPLMKWDCFRYKVAWDDTIKRRTGHGK